MYFPKLKELFKNIQMLDDKIKQRAKDALAGSISYTEGKKEGLSGKLKGVLHALPFIASVESEIGTELEQYAEKTLEGEKLYNFERMDVLKERMRNRRSS